MKHILIVADGLPAKHFIDRITAKRSDVHNYVVVLPESQTQPESKQGTVEYYIFDPTSSSKMRELLLGDSFDLAYVIMDKLSEAKETYLNIRACNEKLKIVMLDSWDAFDENDDEYLKPISINTQIGNKLYDQLPNVPLVAQNVGLSSGEIMEVYVPSGSPFAHRHVGSIAQVKWRIAAIFRNNKLILPKPHEMIQAEDSMLIIGQPKMLNTIYMRISKQSLKIPEPFGRNFYLLLDLGRGDVDAISQIKEARYIVDKIGDKELIIRVVNPSNFELLDEIRAFSDENIDVLVEYRRSNITETMLSDMQTYNIGMVITTLDTLSQGDLKSEIFARRKLLYVFGDISLSDIKESVVLAGEEGEMESISSASIHISKDLDLSMCLCCFDPEGDFDSKKNIIMHYEAISDAAQYPIEIRKKRANPIREIASVGNVLQIAPISSQMEVASAGSVFSTSISDYTLRDSAQPKLLIPIA